MAPPPPIAPPVPIADPVRVSPPPSIAPPAGMAEQPFASRFEDVADPYEKRFLTIQADIQHCGVEMPDLSDVDAWEAKFAEKSIEDIDVAREMANAVADLRTVSRDILASAQQVRDQIESAQPDERKFIEHRAYLLALDAGIVDLIAGQAEELMAATDKIIKEKTARGEDANADTKSFAKIAGRARRDGKIEQFKFKIKEALGKY
jgi:hypothetical protein